MGTWSLPWESGASAERFRVRMARPWMARVSPRIELDFGPPLPGTRYFYEGDQLVAERDGVRLAPLGEIEVQGWEADELYELLGDDRLFDELGDVAQRRRRDFDIRKWVRRALAEMFDRDLVLGEDVTAEDLEAVNVCRRAAGLRRIRF
ncbi:MAG: hypothetical protein AAF211_30855 [Myxococcota bacterium]